MSVQKSLLRSKLHWKYLLIFIYEPFSKPNRIKEGMKLTIYAFTLCIRDRNVHTLQYANVDIYTQSFPLTSGNKKNCFRLILISYFILLSGMISIMTNKFGVFFYY